MAQRSNTYLYISRLRVRVPPLVALVYKLAKFQKALIKVKKYIKLKFLIWYIWSKLARHEYQLLAIRVTRLGNFCQLGYFWELIVIFVKIKQPKEMSTFWSTFLLKQFFTFSFKQAVSKYNSLKKI